MLWQKKLFASLGVCLMVGSLTACGARDTMFDISSYKAGEGKSSVSYAKQYYGGSITVEEALVSLGMSGLEEDTEYYEGFEDMIDAINKSSEEDIVEYYTDWNWLSKVEKLSASYMVMFDIIDINEYTEGVQRTINEYIEEIEVNAGI